jgi:hypothetical protein
MFFAGIWREWEGDRGTKTIPDVGKHMVFSFLTTVPARTWRQFTQMRHPFCSWTRISVRCG